MNRDDATKMAREAGIRLPTERFPALGSFTLPELMHFSDLIAAHEREQCAQLMDDMAAQDIYTNYYLVAARAIRERTS